jgi:hypothetical protein
MLSMTGKIVAVYGLNWQDEVSIRAASDVERLATGLSQKIFQKIIILHDPFIESQNQKTHLENPASPRPRQ